MLRFLKQFGSALQSRQPKRPEFFPMEAAYQLLFHQEVQKNVPECGRLRWQH